MEVLHPNLKRQIINMLKGFGELPSKQRQLTETRELLEPLKALIDEIIPEKRSVTSLPNEVAKNIDFLDTYEWSDDEILFDLFHLYPKELAFPNGFYDARFFHLIAYNSTTMKRRNFGRNHDKINLWKIPCSELKIFADGSTLLKLETPLEILPGQLVSFSEVKK